MIYHGRVLNQLPESVVLGEYILLRQRGVFYGTRLNINQQSLTVYRPVFTGAFRNQGEISLFIDRNSGVVYQFNPLLGQLNLSSILSTSRSSCPPTLPNASWVVSRFTGVNDDGHEMYYFQDGRVERKVPMTTLTISRSSNINLHGQLIDVPLEVLIERITILNESQIQIPHNCLDTMSIPVEVSAFINGSSAALIYSYYNNSQKVIVNHLVNKVLIDNIVATSVESSATFNSVNFLDGWIVGLPNATYVEDTYWQQGEYISRTNGTYDVVFRLNDVQVPLGSVIYLNVQINTGLGMSQSFTIHSQGGNLTARFTVNLASEASLRFGYSGSEGLPTFSGGRITVTPLTLN